MIAIALKHLNCGIFTNEPNMPYNRYTVSLGPVDEPKDFSLVAGSADI